MIFVAYHVLIMLSEEEKNLVKEVKEDVKNKKKDAFASVNDIWV